MFAVEANPFRPTCARVVIISLCQVIQTNPLLPPLVRAHGASGAELASARDGTRKKEKGKKRLENSPYAIFARAREPPRHAINSNRLIRPQLAQRIPAVRFHIELSLNVNINRD